MKTRLTPEHRKALILAHTRELAVIVGLYNITLAEVSDASGSSESTIKYYFRSLSGLRENLIKRAIEHEDWRIVGQALVCHDPLCRALTPDQQNVAIEMLKGGS